MAKAFEVEVTEELANYIEKLDYEAMAYKDIIITMLEAHKNDQDSSCIDSPVFKAYQEKFSNAKAEFDLAKNSITNEFIPDCLKGHKIDWNLNYSTKILTVNVYCDCGEKALEEYLCSKEE